MRFVESNSIKDYKSCRDELRPFGFDNFRLHEFDLEFNEALFSDTNISFALAG